MSPRRAWSSILLLSALATILALAGCSKDAPTVPVAGEETFTFESNPLPVVRAPASPAPLPAMRMFAAAASDSGPSLGCPDDSTRLVFGCAGWAHGDSLLQIGACRYRLRVPPGAVQGDTYFLLRYYAASWIEFELKTYGDTLLSPIEVEIDLGGTNVDPGSSNYDHSGPRAFSYDEVRDQWDRLPAAYDPVMRRIVAQVAATGRIAIGSRAGW